MTDADDFQTFESQLAADGAAAALAALAARFRDEKRLHELFDARLAECRHRLGVPLYGNETLDSLAEPMRSQLEEGYLAACREVGQLLLDERQYRQAWMYLRPAGEADRLRRALEAAPADSDNCQELIELALYEAIAPELGLGLVLKHHGTCNAITAFESISPGLPKDQQQQTAGLMVRHLHAELLSNLRADLGAPAEENAATEPNAPTSAGSLSEIMQGIEGTLAEGKLGEYCCHIDASHLAAVVRFARLVTDRQDLQLAWDLTEYGRRLHANFQQSGEEPFADPYTTHGLFFAAQLGMQVDEALEHFRRRAAEVDIQQQGTAAIEIYATLLSRLGRAEEAMRTLGSVPPGIGLSRFPPSLTELAEKSGEFKLLQEICRERGDLLGFALAGIGRRDVKKPPT